MISKIYLIITSKFLKMMCYHCNSSNIIHTMYEVTHKSANGIMNSFCLVTSFLNCCLAWNPMDQNQTIEPGTEQMEWTEERQAPISKGVICPTHQSPLRVYDFVDFHPVRQSEDYSSSQDAHQEGEERWYGWRGTGALLALQKESELQAGSPGLSQPPCPLSLTQGWRWVQTHGAREWAASSGPKHHQQLPYCHKRENWL